MDLKAALAEAQALVLGIARQLADRFKTHKPEYYHRLLMQHSRRSANVRRVSKWNAFLSQELLRRNGELGPGEKRKKVSQLTKEISEDWNRMTKEEQDRATSDKVLELYEQRANRAYGRQNVPARAFRDARTSLALVERELSALHNRTEVEVLLVVTRGNQQSYVQPYSFITSNPVEDFIVATHGCTVEDLSVAMEGFLLGKMSNTRVFAQNARSQILRLKKEVGSIIDKNLQETSRRGPIRQMKYVNFQDITREYGLVLRNWPWKEAERFKAPGNFSSRAELEILFSMWTQGKTHFRCLTDDEWDAWRLQPTNGLEWSVDFQVQSPLPPATTATIPPPPPATAASPPLPSMDTTLDGGSSSSSSSSQAPSPPITDPSPSTAVGQKRPAEFINTTTSDDGTPGVVTKRPRKRRADAGVKRGPRKKPGDSSLGSSTPGASTSGAGVSGSSIDTATTTNTGTPTLSLNGGTAASSTSVGDSTRRVSTAAEPAVGNAATT
ncbi:hypothetical protein TRAPUB_8583 [Trametes pubescens]|uniref:Uncharacterized protein n=1 Tax=Trametes pubescens TaxID=154538 RepID=A0A1M2W4W3_TRAPU|nr:hypothetical protein TRAPUB_8583 [Trametes pubescens]